MNSLAFILVSLTVYVQYCAGQQCNEKGMRQFDANMARLLTMANSGRSFPTDKGTSLKKWCKESERLIKVMESHKNKCFKDLSKQVFGVFLYSIKSVIRQYCRKDSQKLTDLLEAVPCISKNDPIVTKCYTGYIDGVLGARNAPDSKKIPHLCCEYVRTFDCYDDKLTNAPSCHEKNIETLKDLMRNIAGNVVDLICGDYTEGSDKCQALGPAPKKKKSQKRSRSFAPPVLDLLLSFPAV